ncbi:ABC transporter ATP-binding protein [Gillisia sp. CAL575]|uniref:ABC transporter ATP-binding protein n=1 Tax=Gillisia sp. CAL575 TaxID=985255 RepID=UPI00039FAEEF|nr:ABC transporter ATP-binding protein [Gillisia sp. CAL575]
MIIIDKLYKKFDKNEVLKGINLEIKSGGIIAVLGPNGSGKTTLIKSILGMVIPNSGSIALNGMPVKNNWKYRNDIDYLPQIANFPGNLKVKELINMIKDLRTEKKADDQHLIELFKLEPFLDKKLSNLSGGTKQKVNLVLTFMFDSPLVILDEPTSGLDPISHLRLKELIKVEKEKGKTILITSHIMSFVEEIADEIVFLLEGKIYFKGSIDQLKIKTLQPDFEHAIASILTSNYA